MQEHHFPVTRTARYYTHGEVSDKVEQVWFVLHGYGQLSGYFIRWFQSLDPDQHVVVAPEGLHRFYLQGFAGRVGASWMTKEDRLTDISDYVSYLDRLYAHIMQNFPDGQVKVNLLGFSQGSATVSRWLCNKQSKADRLILWAGVFPPDVPFEACEEALNGVDVYFACGDADEFINDDRLEKEQQVLVELGLDYTFLPFKGPHKVTEDGLQRLVELF